MKLLILPLLFAVALISCESDVATTTLEKKMVVIPTHLEANQYDLCTLKARITNMPLSDIRIEWDLDEGSGFYAGSYTEIVWFLQNKIHFVRVRITDRFTEELLGYDSIRVDVRPRVAFAKFKSDTFKFEYQPGLMNTDGSLIVPLEIFVTYETSTPPSFVDVTCEWGDGATSTSSHGSAYAGHRYARAGHYTIILTATEQGGRYLGTDTATVYIHPPPFTMAKLNTAGSVEAFLVIDSLHPVAADSLFKNPFDLRIPLDHIAVEELFGQSDFSLKLDYQSGDMFLKDTIAGTFSSDFDELRSVHIGVGEVRDPPTKTIRYSYNLRDLELLAVTTTQIIYRTKSPVQDDFLRDLTFSTTNISNVPCGMNSAGVGGSFIPGARPGVFAVVVFNLFK